MYVFLVSVCVVSLIDILLTNAFVPTDFQAFLFLLHLFGFPLESSATKYNSIYFLR